MAMICCRGDENDYQIIDQVLKMYVRSASNPDLLNSKIPGSYTSVSLLDLLSETAQAPVSGSSLQKDLDTITYLDYAAGAVRRLKDSISPELKIYRSKFLIRYSKKTNSQTVNDDDTVEIEYRWTPSRFELSKLWYDNQLIFTKVPGQPNIVTIIK